MEAPVAGVGIGGTRSVVEVAGHPVFVKRVPLTDLERQPEHWRSTANVFRMPSGCQYGVGSPSFGVWRELAANERATAWVEAGRTAAFALLHHWFVLHAPAFPGPLTDELGAIDAAVDHWHGDAGVRRRLEAIGASTASVVLFLEHLPGPFGPWLTDRLRGPDADRDAAIAMAEHDLRVEVAAMNGRGLFHFDSHLDNVLTDGDQLQLVDFGLATSPGFDLTDSERAFLHANRSHDVTHTLTRLVDHVVSRLTDTADWRERDALVAAWAAGERPATLPPAVDALVTRYAPMAALVNRFYARLHLEDRRTPYPAAAIEAAAAAAGLGPW